jgi:DNA-binding transcriptional regulator YiaG
VTPTTFKSIRQRLGLTQSGLAAVLRVNDLRTVRKWEAGERAISGPVSLLMELLDDGTITPHR